MESTGENWQRDLRAATMIAGDLSLLEIQLVAQYYISDLNAYLFQADDPGVTFTYSEGNDARDHRSHPPGRPDGQTIKDALEVAIRRSVGQRTIDHVLVSERGDDRTRNNGFGSADTERLPDRSRHHITATSRGQATRAGEGCLRRRASRPGGTGYADQPGARL